MRWLQSRAGVSSTLASSLSKYYFTVHSSLVKDGDVDPRREGNFGESTAAAAMRVLTRCMSTAAICDRAARAAQTAAIASQVAAATSASGIATGESGTSTIRSAAAALA